MQIKTKMKQEYKNACMGLIPKVDPTPMRSAPHYSTLSYIISIPIPQSKLRIRIPKVLMKTMQKRVHKDVDAHDHDRGDHEQSRNKKKWSEKLLLRKAGCIFTNINVFGNKKSSPENAASKDGRNNVVKDVRGLCHRGNGIEAKKTLEGDDEDSEEVRSEPSPRESLPLAYLFNEEKNMNFNVKGKAIFGCSNKDDDIGANGLKVVGESSRHLIRVPSRISTSRSRRKLRIAVFVRKIESKKCEEHSAAAAAAREESGGHELCKKRILMGSKCKPLNLSGTLQYDNNGILLPEALGH